MTETDLAIVVLTGLFGSLVGSFLNVVIHRLPERKSLVWPGSHCPVCGAPIRWYDNVPLLSFAVLLGRCRACRVRIPLRYPMVEALTAGLAVLVAFHDLVGERRDFGLAAVHLALAASLVAVTFIDAKHRIIPDRITKPGMAAAPILSLAVPRLHVASPLMDSLGDLAPPAAALLVSLLGIVAGAGIIWGMGVLGRVLFRKEAMGFGDVKFMGMIGGFTGPVGVVLAILVACVLGSVIGILGYVVTRSRYIPFGPYLSLGAFVVLFFRPEVVHFVTVTYPGLFQR